MIGTERLVIIGDIHGCYYSLKALLQKIGYTSITDTLVFVGDYIDRGKHSAKVVTTLMDLQRQLGRDKVVCLRGNHEQIAIDSYQNGNRDLWEINGGWATWESYSNEGYDIDESIEWFNGLPIVYNTPEIIICHAGLVEPKLEDNTAEQMLWNRDWIRADTRPREKQVIFGHTPRHSRLAYTVPTGDICIDSGCVYDGRLCGLVISESGTNEFVYVTKDRKD